MSNIPLGIGAPVLGFGFWGPVGFRGAGRLAWPLRLMQELVVSFFAAFAWFVAGQPVLAWTLAGVSVLHHALVCLQGEALLKR